MTVDRDVYATPTVRDYGTLACVTASALDGGAHFLLALGSLEPVPQALPTDLPSGGPQEVAIPGPQTEVQGSTESGGQTDPGGNGGGTGGNGGDADGNGGGAAGPGPGNAGDGAESRETGATLPSGTGAAGGGGELPFTGAAPGAVAALGAAISATGAALRRVTRRT